MGRCAAGESADVGDAVAVDVAGDAGRRGEGRRRGVGVELKASYFRQAVKNVAAALEARGASQKQLSIFDAPAASTSMDGDEQPAPEPTKRKRAKAAA